MPQPTFGDIRRFCEIDEWEQVRGARAKTGDHFRYHKVLPDGVIRRTRASHGSGEIRDRRLWRHIWKDQLGLQSEGRFWEALRTGTPVERGRHDRPPAGPSLPGWLYRALVVDHGLPETELAEMTQDEARARLVQLRSRPQ